MKVNQFSIMSINFFCRSNLRLATSRKLLHNKNVRKNNGTKSVKKTSKTPFYLFLIVFLKTIINHHEPIPLHNQGHYLNYCKIMKKKQANACNTCEKLYQKYRKLNNLTPFLNDNLSLQEYVFVVAQFIAPRTFRK